MVRLGLARVCLISFLITIFGTALSLGAQDFRALVIGRVTDPSGAAIVDATVTAVREGSGQTYVAHTNREGNYSIPYILPGVYSISAGASGFGKQITPNVTLEVSQKLNLNFGLKVGTMSQEVTVRAGAELINTADASGGTVIAPEKVQNLPLNGRQVYMLLALTPGVRFTQTQFGSSGFSGTRGWDVNNKYVMNGVPGGQNQYSLNGAPITQQNNGTWEIAPNVDAVQEFKIQTNNYDAQYGRAAGGTVNMVLKSGGNALHGTAFDYLRNSVLDANVFQNNSHLDANGNPAPLPKGLHIVNQFGGTVGGPIKKNKAFFFGSFEGWRENVPFPVTTSVPWPNLVLNPDGSVNFTPSGKLIYDPSTTACVKPGANGTCNTYGRKEFPNDTIPASRISPIGMKILSLYPQPNSPGLFNNYVDASLEGHYSYNQPIVRVDYNFSEATRVYTLFTWQRGHEFRDSSGFTGPAQRGNINTERDDLNLVLDATHIFSPVLVGDFRFAFGRFHDDFPNGSLSAGTAKLSAAELGLTGMIHAPTTTANFAPEISVDQYPSVIGNQDGVDYYNTFDFAPNFTQSAGRQTLHYGFEYMLMQKATPSVGQANGGFSFGPGFTQNNPFKRNNDGLGLADLLLGYPTGGSISWNATYFGGYPYVGLYFQDDYQIRPHLTLNLGLRRDDEVSVQERFNRINAGFCWTCVNPVTNMINYGAYQSACAAGKYPCPTLSTPMRGGLLFAGVGQPSRPYRNYLTNFQPKFGVSWQLNNKTVLRGGYGISYGFGIELDTQNGFSQGTPYISSVDGGLTPSGYFGTGTPYVAGLVPAIGSSLGLMTSVGNGIGEDDPLRRIPRVQQWSAGFERELPGRVVFGASYVGSYSNQLRASYQFDHLTAQEVAQGAQTPATLDTQVPNPFFGVLPANTSLGSSPKVKAYQLMLPYPEFTGTYEYTMPSGYSSYQALEMKLEKRIVSSSVLTRGLSFLTSFTYSKAMGAQGYLNNGLIQDPTPYRQIQDFDRTLDLAFSGVWELPIGQGGWLAPNARGVLGGALNQWSLDWTVTADTGTPMGFNNYAFNQGGSGCGSISVAKPGYSQWFNNNQACYSDLPEWTPRTMPNRFGWIRNPYASQVNAAVQKQFAVGEGKALQFRAEAFNLTNTPIFPGPDTNKNDTPKVINGQAQGFGAVSLVEQNFPRQIQLSLKVLF